MLKENEMLKEKKDVKETEELKAKELELEDLENVSGGSISEVRFTPTTAITKKIQDSI